MKKKARMESLKKMKEKFKKANMDGMDMDGMSKVTVMSDSEEGLKKGLSKAEEILKKKLADGGCGSKDK